MADVARDHTEPPPWRGEAPTTARIVEMSFLKPGAQQPITVVLPDFEAGRPGAGQGSGMNFTDNENGAGRLILVQTVHPSAARMVAIHE